jgi:hypothetical protein
MRKDVLLYLMLEYLLTPLIFTVKILLNHEIHEKNVLRAFAPSREKQFSFMGAP